MKVRFDFIKPSFTSIKEFNLYLIPTIWINHVNSYRRKLHVRLFNKRSPNKMLVSYTSISLRWLLWGIKLTIGKVE